MKKFPASKAVTAICIEVADPDIMEHWLQEGWMPNLARLRSEGLWTRLESVSDISSGAIWPTFFTGVDPSDHGQFFTHMQLKPGTYEIVKMYADDVSCEPFWLELQRAGCKCAIIDVPQTYPQKDFNGIHIAGWGGEYPAWPQSSWPEALIKDIKTLFGTHPLANKYRVAIKPESPKEYEALIDDLVSGAQMKAAMTRWVYNQGPYDFFMSVFSEPHWAMHLLWDLVDTRHSNSTPQEYLAYAKVFKSVLGIIDGLLCELRRARPEADFMVFSFSGMGPNYSGGHILQDVLDRIDMGPCSELNDYRRFFSPLQRWGSWEKRVIEGILSPRAIEAAKAIIPGGMWDRWTRRLLYANNGWQHSRAFCVPNDYSGAIRINLEGREPCGRVKPGIEYQDVCDEIAQALRELKHRHNGKPVVKEVIQTNTIYSGSNIDTLPDLLVRWQNESLISDVVSTRVGQIRKRFPERRTGAHRPWGIFAAAGPQISSEFKLPSIHLLDLAPTILKILGVTPAAHYRGRAVSEILIEKWHGYIQKG